MSNSMDSFNSIMDETEETNNTNYLMRIERK